ncbi:hypothetical protein LCGC14_0698390 [marine sediment metagenome]|uniref:Uncharacterized protein n=1 Tax=marine sediment metagenome TaxID=412755 RepID=A0A0F9QII0_9ZZZZ
MIPTVMNLEGEELDQRWDDALVQLGWIDLPDGISLDPDTLRPALEEVVLPVWAQLMQQDRPDPNRVAKTLASLFGLRAMLFLYGEMLDRDDRAAVEGMLFRAFETAALWMLEHHQAELAGMPCGHPSRGEMSQRYERTPLCYLDPEHKGDHEFKCWDAGGDIFRWTESSQAMGAGE